jgi:CheY-like chemotaxis protein
MNTVLMLEDFGYTVLEVHSEEDALRLLEVGPLPDAMITDHAMPHMTGAQLAAQVIERYPGIKIVLATGYPELPDAVTSRRARVQIHRR